MNDLISIIVPVYKVEPYIYKCIESILNQTYKNLQIILVDDGSPDNCGKICDEYAKRDSRIEVIHQINSGLSVARNVGIQKAKGKYIGFVDSDDYISQAMYQTMYELIEKKEADVCICNLFNVMEGQEKVRNEGNGIQEYNKIDVLKEIILDQNIQSYAWNKLYKKELFEGVQYPIGKKYEDIGTTFYLLEKCKKVVVTEKPLYYYINRQESIVNAYNQQTIQDYTEIILERYYYIREKYAELKIYNEYYLARTLITAYNDLWNLPEGKNNEMPILEELYVEVKKVIEKDEVKIIPFLNEKQKMQLYVLLYNRFLYKDIIKNLLNET